MRIECKCGAEIADGGGAVENKARLIEDGEWLALAGPRRRAPDPRMRPRTVYECFDCGRLWIGDRLDLGFRCYAPDGDEPPGLLFGEV